LIVSDSVILLRPVRGAKYCDVHVCLSVRSHTSKMTCPDFMKSYVHVVAVHLSSGDNAIHYVFVVSWMASCLLIMGLYGVWLWGRIVKVTH